MLLHINIPFCGITANSAVTRHSVLSLQAIDKLGFAQTTAVTDDNFTVTINGPGFNSLCPNEDPQTCRDKNLQSDGCVYRAEVMVTYASSKGS